MIAIVNVDPEPRPTGDHLYEIRINERRITTFRHRREDSLYRLFLAAADASFASNPPKETQHGDTSKGRQHTGGQG